MTDHVEDTRVIAADAPQYNATLARRVDYTADLASIWVKLDGDPVPFEPGQYMTIGVFADDKLWQRPYSVASAPAVAGRRATSSTSAWFPSSASPRSSGGWRRGRGCG